MTVPRWSRLLLSLVVPRQRREDVLGDLEEVHLRRRRSLGALRAWLSTSAETCLLAAAFLYYRLHEWSWMMPRLSGTDVRFAFRLMWRQPVLALTSVLAMATGIAVATTAFTAADSALYGELPFENGDRFLRIEARNGTETRRGPLDLELFRQFKSSKSFEHVGATDRVEINAIYRSGEVEPLLGAWITPDSFAVLPYSPLVGRAFMPADGVYGAEPAALIAESLWRRRFEASPGVVGETIQLDHRHFRVVGVLPDSAGFPAGGEIWMALDDLYLGGSADQPRRGLSYFGVLREGADLESARLEAAALSTRFREARELERAPRLTLVPYLEPWPQEKLSAVAALSALVTLLIVIASSVANLIYARTEARRGELAVRSALGAGRARLVGQIVLEVVLLAAAAAVIGVIVAQAGLRWLEPRLLEKPFWFELDVGARGVAFAVASTLLSALVAGLSPAIRATRRDPVSALQGGVRGELCFGRFGAGMMVVQLCLAVLMLTFALVIGRSIDSDGWHESVELPKGQVLTAQVLVPRRGDGELAVGSEPTAVRLRRAVESLPSVRRAGSASRLPGQAGFAVSFTLDESPGAARRGRVVMAGVGFVESLAVQPRAGRLLRESDFQADAPDVALATQPFVVAFLRGRSAVGQGLSVSSGGAEATRYEIIGVVPDLGLAGGGPDRGAGLIVPQRREARRFYLTLLTESRPEALAGALRRAVADVDPALRVARIMPLEQVTADHRALVGGFGGALVAVGFFVLALAALGFYALVSFGVTRRTREIGLRLALGASRLDILRTILGAAGRPLVLGSLLGAALTVGAGLLKLHEKLFALPLQPAEAWVLPSVLLALLAAGLVACLVPARRALGIHPSQALRE